MVVLKYKHYNMVDDLIKSFSNPIIVESDDKESTIKSILKGLSKDLKFNYSLVFTFGVGISVMFPIVENLIKNGNLKIELTIENIVLVSLASLAITYLEETNNKAGDDKVACECDGKNKECEICQGRGYIKSDVSKKDAQTILEELKLRGIGNGIVKKMVSCFQSIGNIGKILFKNSAYVINGLIDMLGYTALLIPTMNCINSLIGKYDLNMDTLPGNFLSIGFGVGTFLSKQGFDYLVKKLKINKRAMTSKYLNFQSYKLFESILKVDKDFEEIISILNTDKRDTVAKSIFNLFNTDIKTNINYIKTSDKNDDVNFVNDSQVKRIIDANGDPFSRTSNVSKVGRAVRQILNLNSINFTDQQIESFVDLYKSTWDRKFKKMEGLQLVKGDAIKHWYLEDNYVPGGGTLNSSCMRYQNTQDFFKIYIENPEACQLLILLDERGLLLGRALVWKLIPSDKTSLYYLDRIYTRHSSDASKFTDWFKDFLKVGDYEYNSYANGKANDCQVQLKNWNFEKYPYMDTFGILDFKNGILKPHNYRNSSELQFLLQVTGGYPDVPNYCQSEKHGWIHNDEAVWVESEEDYLYKSECVEDFNGDWILDSDSIYSDFYKKKISKKYAQENPLFGLIDSRDLVTVYDDLSDNGRPISPTVYLKSLIGTTNKYASITIGWENVFMSTTKLIYNVSTGNWVLNNSKNFKDLMYLYKMTSSEVLQFEGIFAQKHVYGESIGYYTPIDEYQNYIPFIIKESNDGTNNSENFYATELNLNCLGFKKDDRNMVITNDLSYYKYYLKMIFSYSVDKINDIKGIDHGLKLQEMEIANKMLLDNDISTYVRINNSYEKLKKYGSILNYVNSELVIKFNEFKIEESLFSKKVCEKIRSYIGGEYISCYSEKSKTYIDIQTLEDVIEFLKTYKYYIYFYTYFYSLEYSASYCDTILSNLDGPDGSKITEVIRRIISYIVLYSEVSSDFPTNVNSLRRYYHRNFDMDFSEELKSRKSFSNPQMVGSGMEVVIQCFDDFYKRLDKQ